MISLLLPHGSKRRSYIKGMIGRLRNKRRRDFHEREYNDYRQEYYRTITRLMVDDGPLISIVVPCWNTEYVHLQALVDSVFAQGYENWELILADASSNPDSIAAIKNIASYDNRITYEKLKKNEGISKNTNAALRLAKGDYIAFLDHDDTLDPDALAYAVKAIKAHDPDLLYSDEDKVTDDGSRYFEPHFKPDFSLSMLRSVNYITHFVVVKREIVDKVGMIEEGFDGAQDYNFLLNVADVTEKIHHIPRILYHWRQAKTSTASDFGAKTHITAAGAKAVSNHLKRRKIAGIGKAIENRPGFYEIEYQLTPGKRAVVIDLPSCNATEREFIRKFYETNPVIKKEKIDVIERSLKSLREDEYDEIIYVNKPVIPMRDEDHSINKLFGMLNAGARFTSPKKTSRGKLTDCGLVYHKGSLVQLFYGTDPTAPQYFGTHEWNREVNGLQWGVMCGRLKDIKEESAKPVIVGDGLVIVGQTEYLAFNEGGHTEGDARMQTNYFNPNLGVEIYPRLIQDEPLQERVPIGK